MTVAVHTGVCGGMYFHRMTMAAGDVVPTHRHTYGHVMQILAGRAEIWAQGGEAMKAEAGDMLPIPAGVAHDVCALVDGTVVQCVHVMHLADGTEMPFAYQPTSREVFQITAAM